MSTLKDVIQDKRDILHRKFNKAGETHRMKKWKGNIEVFRAYFHGKDGGNGKGVPNEPIKGMSGHEWGEVENDAYFGAVLNDGFVDISFDSKELSDIFVKMAEDFNWKCLILRNPKNGNVHSYWRKFRNWTYTDGRDVQLAIGLKADIHSGSTYIRLRDNGVDRFPPVYESEHIQELPKYFTPLPKCNIDFANMHNGDGRNNTLFGYILSLQYAGFEEDEIRETIRIINKYVLPEPLDAKELDTILRDDAFKKELFYKNKKFSHDVFAEYIRKKYHVKQIYGQLHIYQDGVYVMEDAAIRRAMIKEISSLTSRQRDEVLKYLRLLCTEESQGIKLNLNLIAFKNGIYNLDTDTLEPFSPEYIITNKIPWNYNPYAESQLVDHVLDRLSCGDKSIRYVIEEVAGSCLYRSGTLGGGKGTVLVGDKSNGKSTLIHMIQSMLGEENYSVLDLKELGDRFSTQMLLGKLANLGDDISDMDIKDVSVLKKVITGETLKAEKKGQDAFKFTPYATHVYSANKIPRINDPTGAVLRRLLFIPLNGKFTSDSPDYNPNIRYELGKAEHMEYFIQCALDGLADVLKNNSYTTPEKSKKVMAAYEVENNPILSFIEEVGEESIINNTTEDVYTRYKIFCNENGFEQCIKPTFSKNINKLLGTETKGKKIMGINKQIYKMVEDK